MVNVLAFYSDDPSLNPAEAYCFYVKILFETNKNKQIKRPELAPFWKKEFKITGDVNKGRSARSVC